MVINNVPLYQVARIKNAYPPINLGEPMRFSRHPNNPMKLLYLPAYSPFLNPIEEVFGWIKNRIKRGRPCGRATLFDMIEVAQKELPAELVASFYCHVDEFIPQCLAGQEIS